MATTAAEPGSPEWWLNRLIHRLMARQARYNLLEAYVTGNHPLPEGDRRYVKTLAEMQRRSRTNYVGLVVKTPVERMQVKGFRFGGSASEADEEARRIWSANNMDYQAPILHMQAASLGDSYIMVSPPEEEGPWSTGLPVITVEDPRSTIVENDPANPMRAVAGLRMWEDYLLQKIVVQLHTPDTIYMFVGPSVQDCQNLDTPSLTKKLLSSPQSGGLRLVSESPNPLQTVAIVQASWIPSMSDVSAAEHEDVLDIQDRINSQILERTIITKMQAYKQRYVSGAKIDKNKDGSKKPPFDPGADMLWVVEDPNVKFGEFDQVDIQQLLEAVRDDVGDMAAITKTPAHYLMNRMANVSGDTLTQAEAGLVSKTRQRMIAMGWAWERVMRLAFAYLGNAKASEIDAEVIWSEAQLHTRAELADAFGKEVAGGLPIALASERLGLEPDQIAFVVEESKRKEAEAKAAEEQQVAMQQEALRARANQNANPQEGEPSNA